MIFLVVPHYLVATATGLVNDCAFDNVRVEPQSPPKTVLAEDRVLAVNIDSDVAREWRERFGLERQPYVVPKWDYARVKEGLRQLGGTVRADQTAADLYVGATPNDWFREAAERQPRLWVSANGLNADAVHTEHWGFFGGSLTVLERWASRLARSDNLKLEFKAEEVVFVTKRRDLTAEQDQIKTTGTIKTSPGAQPAKLTRSYKHLKPRNAEGWNDDTRHVPRIYLASHGDPTYIIVSFAGPHPPQGTEHVVDAEFSDPAKDDE